MNFRLRNVCCFTIVLMGVFLANGQERYIDAIFSDIKISTLVYADTLALDFYSAKDDRNSDRPIIVLVHGGGFASGKRNNPLEKEFCTAMAQKGYAVASISYRLVRKGKGFGCDCPAVDKIETFQYISEDILSACKFLKNQAQLNFDPRKIILAGSSAGAEGVLNTVFMQNHYAFKNLPYENLSFAGVVSFSGAVLNADYITSETAVPTFLVHGANDRLVPYGTDPHHFCEEGAEGYLILDGSRTIAQKIADLGHSYMLLEDPNGNHDWANLGFAHTSSIARFIKEVVLEGKNNRTKVSLNAKKIK